MHPNADKRFRSTFEASSLFAKQAESVETFLGVLNGRTKSSAEGEPCRPLLPHCSFPPAHTACHTPLLERWSMILALRSLGSFSFLVSPLTSPDQIRLPSSSGMSNVSPRWEFEPAIPVAPPLGFAVSPNYSMRTTVPHISGRAYPLQYHPVNALTMRFSTSLLPLWPTSPLKASI